MLYLSTDANPANKKLIAQETAWSNAREYTISGGNSVLASKDSSQFAGTEWPVRDDFGGGALITLEAGQAYYIEALFKEGTGGDFLSVAVLDPNFVVDYTMPIPGQFLSSDRTLGAATITRQPESQSVPERGSVTFSVLADGTPPYTYQWRMDGENIPDATGLTYTLQNASMDDDGALISVVVTGADGSGTSEDAVVTVIPDTVQPTVVSAKNSPSLSEVVVTFSEPVQSPSATTAGNYQISSAGGPLNITAATLAPGGSQVILTTAAQTLGAKYTLIANNIQDTAATPNTIPADSRAVFIATGDLIDLDGLIVVEAENYDRNPDGLWVRDTTRGNPSGGSLDGRSKRSWRERSHDSPRVRRRVCPRGHLQGVVPRQRS